MKWVGRIFLVILLVLVLGVVIQLVRWSMARQSDPEATFIVPRMQVARMNIEQLDPDTTRMNMVLAINNPSPIGFTVDSLEYTLSIAEKEVIRSTYAHTITLRGSDSASIELPVMVLTKKLGQVLKQLEALGVDSVEYTMEARLHVPAAFWRKEPMTMRIARRLPLIMIPKVDARDPALEKFGFGESRVTVDVALFNPNVFAFDFRQLDFTAELSGHEVMSTTIDTLVHIPAQDTVVLHIPLSMAPGRLVSGVINLLVKPARTPYSYNMAFTIVSESASLNNCRFVLAGDGMLDELKAMRGSKEEK